jgi:hypothetical protein
MSPHREAVCFYCYYYDYKNSECQRCYHNSRYYATYYRYYFSAYYSDYWAEYYSRGEGAAEKA